MLTAITFFKEVPKGLEEAAALDGCSVWTSFRHVILPLVRPALVTSAVLTAMFSWNEFLIASSVTDQTSQTLPVQISTFMTDKGTNLGELSAVAVVVVLPIALFILVTQRSLVRGLTLGAVKRNSPQRGQIFPAGAVVTGGANGIGLAIVRMFCCPRPCAVTAVDNDEQALEARRGADGVTTTNGLGL